MPEVRLPPPLEPPSVRDFVRFEKRVWVVGRPVRGVIGVTEAWSAAPTCCFTNPYAVRPPPSSVGRDGTRRRGRLATTSPATVTADELEPYRDLEGFLRLAPTAS
ncbi:hypothetical protein ACFV20_29395 [Streptomyces sp. NPDC059696]|uniref:hypothetical protein n=1 Tax=Streptomyces sp. NPDC059696 TaxID=3346911 RepID=UPI0036C60359